MKASFSTFSGVKRTLFVRGLEPFWGKREKEQAREVQLAISRLRKKMYSHRPQDANTELRLSKPCLILVIMGENQRKSILYTMALSHGLKFGGRFARVLFLISRVQILNSAKNQLEDNYCDVRDVCWTLKSTERKTGCY